MISEQTQAFILMAMVISALAGIYFLLKFIGWIKEANKEREEES